MNHLTRLLTRSATLPCVPRRPVQPNRRIRLVWALCLATTGLLGGCAGLPAKPFGQQGQFEQFALNDNVFRLRYTGEAYTRSDVAEERLLLFAAQVTLQKGYSHFEVLPQPAAQTSRRDPPRVRLGWGMDMGWGWRHDPHGWGGSWNRDDIWGWNDEPWPNPVQTGLTIACHHGDQTGKTLFNARTILSSLGPRHGLDADGKVITPAPAR